jgi:hypothetical protein
LLDLLLKHSKAIHKNLHWHPTPYQMVGCVTVLQTLVCHLSTELLLLLLIEALTNIGQLLQGLKHS